ncbi:hypothetical protein [Peribacillus acanthi]|uniref:hypothetical protein n=1 Tax=Peribacillus acanthi TaxID=2171554 RepID=UPI000D3ECF76|nr:hypothetical protein [Peribacillus acanthi]
MWKVIGIIAITLLFVYLEALPLLKQKKVKDLIVFYSLQVLATTLAILIALEVNIASPLEILEKVYKPISDAVFTFLS